MRDCFLIEGLEPKPSMSIFGENELSPKNYSFCGCAFAPKLAEFYTHCKHIKLTMHFWLSLIL